METTKWSEHVILVQADYVDRVAFDLSVNYERMLGRRIPKADLAHWLVCAALDGGVTPGANEIQVVLIHSKEKKQLDNFLPASFSHGHPPQSSPCPLSGQPSILSFRSRFQDADGPSVPQAGVRGRNGARP